jgi:protein-S-isoprenylcysteine O-methyltransferase Ste14
MASSSQQREQHAMARKSSELAAAVPQIVAHRVTRMVMAGPLPSERDRTEFKRMVQEKHDAFSASWAAMSAQALVANHALALTVWRTLCYPWLGGGATPGAMATQLHSAGMGVLNKGLAPVHRTAVANAKRLARTRLR